MWIVDQTTHAAKTAETDLFPFDESPVAADGCHDAVIAVAERFHRASFESGQQVFPQMFSLGNSDASQLRVSVRILRVVVHRGDVADGENVVVLFDPVESVHADPSAAFFGLLSEARNGAAPDAARPDQVLGRDALPVVEDRAAVDIIGHFSVQHHFDAFALQGFQRFSRGLFRHGREQASQSFDQVDAHVRHVQPRVIPRHHVTSHFG